MDISVKVYGGDLLKLGYKLDRVVHNYGDLCQHIPYLAVERDAPFSITEFRPLNRRLDSAIADRGHRVPLRSSNLNAATVSANCIA